MDNYKITPKYKAYKTDLNNTLDGNREQEYWDKTKILASESFQWSVYKYISNKISSNDLVVDIGCGTAYKLINIIGKKTDNIIGVDQIKPIEYCRSKYNKGSWFVDDFEDPKLEFNRTIDFIINSDVIEHLLDPDLLLDYIKNIASKKTIIIFSTPDRDRMRGKNCLESNKPEHIREWNYEEFNSFISSRGFQVVEHFHMYPLKFTLNNYRVFFQILFNKFFGGNGKNFKYNQVLVCKLKAKN